MGRMADKDVEQPPIVFGRSRAASYSRHASASRNRHRPLSSPVIRTIAHREFASLGLRVPVKCTERVPNTTIITSTATATATVTPGLTC